MDMGCIKRGTIQYFRHKNYILFAALWKYMWASLIESWQDNDDDAVDGGVR